MNWKKLNPIWWIQNDDDKYCPSDMWVGYPNWLRNLLWILRNPFHNFTFYVIGMADKLKCRKPYDVFNETGDKHNIILPFYSYYGDTYKFYIGWRERGNFGVKFTKRTQ